jgi:hypothetical protein
MPESISGVRDKTEFFYRALGTSCSSHGVLYMTASRAILMVLSVSLIMAVCYIAFISIWRRDTLVHGPAETSTDERWAHIFFSPLQHSCCLASTRMAAQAVLAFLLVAAAGSGGMRIPAPSICFTGSRIFHKTSLLITVHILAAPTL